MTKKEALDKCLLLWEYLEAFPCNDKDIAYDVLGLEDDLYGCPVCQYVEDNFPNMDIGGGPDNNCWTKCPIQWGKSGSCMQRGTVYRIWVDSYGTRGAGRMVSLIKKSLRVLAEED